MGSTPEKQPTENEANESEDIYDPHADDQEDDSQELELDDEDVYDPNLETTKRAKVKKEKTALGMFPSCKITL